MASFETLALLLFVLACATAASTGIIFRPGDWYRRLAKPSWRPPNWVFGPVWLVLYLSIAVAGWLVWLRAGFDGAGLALAVYASQLVLNGLWPVMFFGLHRPDLALAEMAALLLSIIATIGAFYPIHQGAAYLLLPYAAWVAFALALNFRIWRINPARAASSKP